MAIKQIGREYCPSQDAYIEQYVADTLADIPNLPTCCSGSSAIVVDTGDVYMVNASGKWTVFGG